MYTINSIIYASQAYDVFLGIFLILWRHNIIRNVAAVTLYGSNRCIYIIDVILLFIIVLRFRYYYCFDVATDSCGIVRISV